jgi:hypothetical protein
MDFEISLEIGMWLVDQLIVEQRRRQRVMEFEDTLLEGVMI